jgi:DMSO/TMAO reductase YedYZ molybdopterin-dependent catalytic subunit
LIIDGPRPYALTLADIEAAAVHDDRFPISCVEGWSAGADWRGLLLLDVVRRAGAPSALESGSNPLSKAGHSITPRCSARNFPEPCSPPHLNGDRINLDHGYPLRLIAPNRAGVLNTKWLSRIVVL